jgi:hypothetical protein
MSEESTPARESTPAGTAPTQPIPSAAATEDASAAPAQEPPPPPPPPTAPPYAYPPPPRRPRRGLDLVLVGVVGLILGALLGVGMTAIAVHVVNRHDTGPGHGRYVNRGGPDGQRFPNRRGPGRFPPPAQPQPSPSAS